MKVDGGIAVTDGGLGALRDAAARAEELGYDGLWSAETQHDPFLPLVVAAEHTTRVELGTGITVAFARSPMTLAQTGYDLQLLSGGRFLLGLGSQIRPHIEKRYSMPWSRPAARMRELILAVRAIWDCWNHRTRLDFHGDFYTHTLMTPFFDPGPNPHGAPRVFLAAVGERMTEVAGEVADGLLVHGFTTERYLREVSIPALERGLTRSGRARADVELSCPVFVVTGDTDEQMAVSAAAVRAQIAFYGSTPSYRAVLDRHGWGDLQAELHSLSKHGRWAEMGALVDDEMLRTFAVVAPPEELPALLLARFSGALDRVSFHAPYATDPEWWARVVTAFKA